MNSGMYSALSGNIAAMRRMDIIANNLANVNTPGFKKDKMLFESMLASAPNPPVVPQPMTADPILQKENVFIDYAPGAVSQTGNVFDLALDGDGFFEITTPNGPAYTRQGNFRLSAEGGLVTTDGNPVMGQDGPIRIQGKQVDIDAAGVVSVDGTPSGTIRIVDFPRPYNLTKTGSTLFVPTPQNGQAGNQPVASQARIMQGHLEGSNVDTITEMVQMIETNRYFDACQRVVKGFDDMAGKAANELARM